MPVVVSEAWLAAQAAGFQDPGIPLLEARPGGSAFGPRPNGVAFGVHRFNLDGVGDPSVPSGEGVGTLSVGTIADGVDPLWLFDLAKQAAPQVGPTPGAGPAALTPPRDSGAPFVIFGAPSVSGRIRWSLIQHVVREQRWLVRRCYDSGLRANPDLVGRVVVRFVIGRDGRVSNVGGGGDLPDGGVVSCVTRLFYGLRFPRPRGGIVTVSYPIVLAPG